VVKDTDKTIDKILMDVLPYLVVKHEQATLLLECCRLKHQGRAPSEGELNRLKEIKAHMTELNRKGG
jgi:hypothetical protein